MNAVVSHLLFPGAHFVSYHIFLVSCALAMSPGLGSTDCTFEAIS